jgi:catechol 2,3-dioxygenase-like lactoylglutathione lyase family enzyme
MATDFSPLVRTALLVRNLERARAWYGAVLGLTTVYFEGDLSATSSWRLLGMKEGSPIRACILKAAPGDYPVPDFGMLGLFEMGDASIPEIPGQRAEGVRFGEAVIVFYHRNLDEATRLAVEHGGSVVCPAIGFKIPGRADGREMVLRDPDGVAVNLIEAPPATAWDKSKRWE